MGLLIGICSLFCAGKSTATDFFKSKGFKSISLSDILREELNAKGIELSRENLIMRGNELRAQHGEGVLVKIALEKYVKSDENWIIESIRKREEVQELKKQKSSVFIIITSSQQTRFNRMIARNREKDPKIWEDFLKLEVHDPQGAHLEEGIIIENEGTIDELNKELEEVLLQLSAE